MNSFMNSYKHRSQAIEIYIKFGKRVRAPIRQLVYPTKNALSCWCRKFEECLDLTAGYAGRENTPGLGKKAELQHE